MKFLILYIFLFFLFLFRLSGQEQDMPIITGSFRNMNFQEFVTNLETRYPIHFYYNDKWVRSININLEVQSVSIPELMDKLLPESGLDYIYHPPSNVFVFPDTSFVQKLPEYYYYSKKDSDSLLYQSENLAGMELRYLNGRHPDRIKTIRVGNNEKAIKGKLAAITARLADDETGEPLIGATVYIPQLKHGAVTDYRGYAVLSVKPGFYDVEFQCLGMAKIKGSLDVRSEGSFTLSLKRQDQLIREVMIFGQNTMKRGSKLGMESVSVKIMKDLPTLMGEKDVLRVAQMLPGIVSVGEGSAGVNVRGGNVDQNLFYINEIPIYNTSHLFGFFSAINSDIIENFSVYKGQVPVEFGGRLSSVFNVDTRKGNKNKFFTQGGISPVSASAEIELPLVKEKVSLILSGRSSYSDWILRQLDDPNLRNSQASFYDFAGGLDFNMNEKNQINTFAYYSNDHFNMNGYTEYAYGNAGAKLNYIHRFSSGLKSSVSFIGSNYNFETVERSSASEAYQHAYEISQYEFRTSLNWLASEKHTFKIGLDAILYDLNRGIVEPYGSGSLKSPVDLGNESGLETSVFLDDNLSLGPHLNLYAGIRFSMYTELGPKTVREYYLGAPMDDNNVSGTIEYQGKDKISQYHSPEIRVGLDYKIRENNSVKLSVTQMSQYLFMLSNSIAIAPNDQWKLVDTHIMPPKSIQYSAGYFQEMHKLGMAASAEFYYKQGKHIVEYRDGADFLSSPYVETSILQGNQDAYGAEFMVSRSARRFNGWTSYAYSRSFMSTDGEKDWEDINRGKKYPSNYDKPHVLNLVLNYKLNRRFSFSSNLAYSTGRPVTMPKSVYYVEGEPFVDYSDRNEYRIPDYLRLDLSIKVEGNLRSVKPMHSYWTIGVYNLTGRSNANSVFFLSEENRLHGYKYSVIGVPIFTISWNWKLGNYENN